jgi:hypothetical protein
VAVRAAYLVAVLVALHPVHARAALGVEEIRALIQKAKAAYESERYAEAGALYLEAHEALIEAKLPDKPILFFNAALAFQRGRECDRAAELFDRFVEADASALEDPEFVAKRNEAESCAPMVRIDTRPVDARVFIDQVERGVAPVRLHLRKGLYQISVEAEGYASASAELEVTKPIARTYVLRSIPRNGELIVDVPADAELVIDGRSFCKSSCAGSHSLPPGGHRIEAARGDCRERKDVILTNSSARVGFELSCPVAKVEAPPPKPSIGPPALLYGSVAVVAASLIAGSVLAVLVDDRIDDWNTAGVGEKNELRSEAFALAHGRNAAFTVAGAALLGVGVGLWWTFE